MFKFLRRPIIFTKRNTSTLLTLIGAGGVIATSVMVGVATPKALKIVDRARAEKGEELTVMEKVKAAGPAYIPAVTVGASTIACIFGANILNQRHQASLMSAYALLDSSYKRYRAKVQEMFVEGDVSVLKRIAREDYDHNEYELSHIDNQCLFYDTVAMRYFESTETDLQRAELELNQRLITHGYACLNDFYKLLKIPTIDGGDKLGWSTYAHGLQYGCGEIAFHHTKVELDDGLECTIIGMATEPSLDYLTY